MNNACLVACELLTPLPRTPAEALAGSHELASYMLNMTLFSPLQSSLASPAPATIAHSPYSFKLVEMLESREHDLLASLFDLASKEDLVEDGVDLVEVEDEVELAHVAEEGVQDLDEEVDGLEIRQLVVVGVDARAEEEARVPSVHHLVVPELDEVGLVFLVAGRYEAVDLKARTGCVLVELLQLRFSGNGEETDGGSRWL